MIEHVPFVFFFSDDNLQYGCRTVPVPLTVGIVATEGLTSIISKSSLCCLVVRVLGYRSGGPG
jgi:hypothetical protein